jgi:hypothetical protein
VPTPAVVLDFNLELAVAMLMHEEPFAMAVLEMISPVVMRCATWSASAPE